MKGWDSQTNKATKQFFPLKIILLKLKIKKISINHMAGTLI